MCFLRSIIAVAVAATIAISPQSGLAQASAQPRDAAAAPITDGATDVPPAGSSTAPSSVPANRVAASQDSIPVGTTITMQNWQTYRDFMPDDMAVFFEGRYFWKMPADVQMPVGPTIIHPLPVCYMNATEKYSSQIKITELPDGGLTLTGYSGGIPFPQPDEPYKGWKILANLWYRYTPHLTVNTKGVVCFVDSSNSVSCKAGMKIYRQLSYNTDPGVASSFPTAEGQVLYSI
jgi:uncharacterized protein DUF1329